VLPRSRQFVREAQRRVLRGHLERLTLGWLRGPTLDRQLLHVLAFGKRLAGLRLAQNAVGLEVGEVSTQAPIGERAQRRLGAEVAEQALEHVLVAGDRGSLQSPLTLALGQPAFDCLLEGALDDVLDLCSRPQLLEDRLQARLCLLRRQVLRARLGAVPCPPGDRAASGAPP
jgi:hypothetical protein